MRVCLDTSTLRVRHSGIAVYTLELVQALLGQIGADDGLVSFDGIGGFAPIDTAWPARMRAANEARILGQIPGAAASVGLLEGVMRGGRVTTAWHRS